MVRDYWNGQRIFKMICLDTSFIIDFLKEDKAAVEKYYEVMNNKIFATEINYFEVLYGVFKRKIFSLKELQITNIFFDSLTTLPLEHNSTYKAAQISGELTKKGLFVELSDTFIAGICLANGCNTIITKNKKHFDRIKGLKVESY